MQNNELQDDEIEYEKNQNFNKLVAWLHTNRYNNILNIFDELSASDEAKTIHVIDIGCAHGKLFSILKDKYKISYIGIELNSEFVKTAEERYKKYSNFKIIQGAAENYLTKFANVDIVVALETLEHIPEHIVVRIVEEIAKTNPRFFVSSVPVEIGPAIWFKNIGSLMAGYMRHNEYSWKETFWAGLGSLDKLPPHDTGHKGFDWRWLAQTIRHNMKIREIRKFPFSFLPAALSTSVFFVAESRLDE